MTHWKNITNNFLHLIIILLLIITIIPTNTITSSTLLESKGEKKDISALKGTGEFSLVPTLTKEPITDFSKKSETYNDEKLGGKKNPSFFIGEQTGSGGGSYSISDSFNWTGTEIINTTNKIYGLTGLPTLQADSVSIQDQTEFQLQYKYFNLSTIQSEYDWRLIENKNAYTISKNSKHVDYDITGGDMWMVIAISFEITEDYANLSSVMTYHDNSLASGVPNGKLWIEGCSNGQPDGNKIAGTEQSLLSGDTWNQYDFDQILLSKGEYFVIMKDFDNTTGYYFIWEATRDDATPFGDGTNTSKVLVRYPNFNSNWVEPDGISYDAPLQIRVKPVEADGSAKKYSLENDVKIWYNTSANGGSEVLLDSTSWFKANDTSTHLFKSNTSVSFDLTFVANYTSPQPIDGVSTYRAQNETVTNWNITFSTLEANQTYAVTNRHISLTTIPTDWNGSKIYWNTTLEYPSLTTDANVTWDGDPTHKYTHGNTTMVVNASTLAVNTTWHVWWDAPNYLLAFNLSRGGTELALPYEANVTDILDLEFEMPEIGGNISYWIEYYGADIQKNLNFDTSNFLITDSWDINASVSQTTNVNGTYGLQGFWINSDETKVGTFTRNVDIFINTSLTVHPEIEAEVIIGEILKVRANYTSIHNDSLIKNAKIWCNSSWASAPNETMIQFANNTYGASLPTTGMTAGETGTVIITTQLPWFVNWTEIIHIYFVQNSSLVVNVTSLSLEWRANETLRIEYNTTGGSGIPAATICVDGDSQNTISISDVYYYRLNSTKYGGNGTFPSLLIKANRSGYLTREWYFDLTITLGHTNITGSYDGEPLLNDTEITQYFANSSSDNVTINLQYYHNLTKDNLDTIAPSVVSPISDYTTLKDDLSWNITFNPDTTGVFLIYITFYLDNYKNSTFILHLTIIKSGAAIESKLSANTPVYYNEYLDFFLLYNNTNYNENITGLSEGTGFSINNSKVDDLNQTVGGYWFRFNPDPSVLPLGYHAVNITFWHADYNASFIEVTFVIIPRPTSIVGTDADDGQILTNRTEIFIRNYSPGKYDNFSIWLRYYDNRTGTTLNVSDIANVEIDDTIDYTKWKDPYSNNWTFVFNGSVIGNYVISITFTLDNHTTATFIVRYIVKRADSLIEDQSVPPSPTQTDIQANNYTDLWIIWMSEYGEPLNDSDGVEINNSFLVELIDTDPLTGNHSFRFTAYQSGIITISLTLETDNHTAAIFLVRFNVYNRTMTLDLFRSTHNSGEIVTDPVLCYGDLYFFYIFLNDTETRMPLNISDWYCPPSSNISFANFTTKGHLFSFSAFKIDIAGPFIIQFKKENYMTYTYEITFDISVANSILDSPPSILTTYYSRDMNFSVGWKNIPNLNTSSEIWITSSNIQAPLPCVFQGVTNGNYTFLIRANQTGTFHVVLRFFSSVFEDKLLSLTIEILPIPTEFVETSPINGSTIGELVPYFYFSESYNIAVVWRENFNSTTIIDPEPTFSGNGKDFILLETPFTNQTHIFTIHATSLGTYQVIITFDIDNFEAINYIISFKVTIMPTKPLTLDNITINHPNNTLLIEEVLSLNGSGFKTIKDDLAPIEEITLKMNNTLVPPNKLSIIKDQQFAVNLSTESYHWGFYTLTIELNTTGYAPQALNLSIYLNGRQIKLTVDIPQGKTIERGENITINVLLEYADTQGGGTGSTVNLAPLRDVNVTFYVVLKYENGSNSDPFKESILSDSEGRASYTIDGQYTKIAVGFANISVFASSSSSGLPSAYVMPQNLLDGYRIQKPFIERMLEIIIPIISVLVVVIILIGSIYVLNTKRTQRSLRIRRGELKIEQSFEDIKSIRLLIARHESGLQFYSEKTIAELQTDTDALSGMSAALSSFMEEVSDAMRSRPEGQREDKIEVMSREGLHMLIWHGKYSSFIIISEVRLPDYFQDRLKQLGHEVEDKYAPELQDFYSADQIPSSAVKKMVRKYIPLHYFSAFILNEGVLTLESIKLSGKEKNMFKLIKQIRFEKDGVPFLFSEQIISHLSAHFKRSEAIKFLNYAVDINLLVEASQEDILSIGK